MANVHILLCIEYFPGYVDISFECRQAIRSCNTNPYSFRLVKFFYKTDNLPRISFEHCKCQMFCDYVGSLQGLFSMDIEYDTFFALKNHVREKPEEKNYSEQKYPEGFFANTFFDFTVSPSWN